MTTTTLTLTEKELDYLAGLIMRDLKKRQHDYDKPEQVAKREALLAQGKRDVAGWQIEKATDLLDKIDVARWEA